MKIPLLQRGGIFMYKNMNIVIGHIGVDFLSSNNCKTVLDLSNQYSRENSF
jgi:hypothetical protein